MFSFFNESDVSDDMLLQFTRYLDGALDDDEAKRLNDQLRSNPAFCRQAAYLLLLEQQLTEIGQEEREAALLAREEPQSERYWRRMIARILGRLSLGSGWAIASAAFITAVLLAWAGWWHLSTAPRLAEIDGLLRIQRGRFEVPAKVGAVVKPGDELRLGRAAAATIRFGHEPTRLRLSGAAVLRVGTGTGGKTIYLEAGTVDASVARQPKAHPMRVLTRQAEVTILGTEFVLTSGPDETAVEVLRGRVQVSRLTDHKLVHVQTDEFTVVREQGALETQPLRRGLLLECWRDVQGSRIRDLTSINTFAKPPAEQRLLPQLEFTEQFGDLYGVRLRGWVCPPNTGTYHFWIAADDAGELWLSRNENPEPKQLLCYTPEHTSPREWEKRPEQQSRSVPLVGGQRYYLEVLMKQAGGAECLAVAWEGPGHQRQVIAGQYLLPVRLSQPAER